MATKKDKLPEGYEYWPQFRNVTYVRADHDAEKDTYTVVGQRGESWVVPGHEFRTNYKPVTPNKS